MPCQDALFQYQIQLNMYTFIRVKLEIVLPRKSEDLDTATSLIIEEKYTRSRNKIHKICRHSLKYGIR